MEAEAPNPHLHSFSGFVRSADGQKAASIDNFLPRGAFLKNTGWAIGMVVFTGVDTKLMLNAKVKKRPKISRIERQLTTFVLQIFAAQLLIALSLTLLSFTVDNLSYVQLKDQSYNS